MTDPGTITQAELAEALDSFWLHVACGGQRVHGQVADPGEVASVLLATLGRIAAERSPDGPTIDAAPPGEAGPGTHPPEASPSSLAASRERAGACKLIPHNSVKAEAAKIRQAFREITEGAAP
jgi:hypothetical protein